MRIHYWDWYMVWMQLSQFNDQEEHAMFAYACLLIYIEHKLLPWCTIDDKFIFHFSLLSTLGRRIDTWSRCLWLQCYYAWYNAKDKLENQGILIHAACELIPWQVFIMCSRVQVPRYWLLNSGISFVVCACSVLCGATHDDDDGNLSIWYNVAVLNVSDTTILSQVVVVHGQCCDDDATKHIVSFPR